MAPPPAMPASFAPPSAPPPYVPQLPAYQPPPAAPPTRASSPPPVMPTALPAAPAGAALVVAPTPRDKATSSPARAFLSPGVTPPSGSLRGHACTAASVWRRKRSAHARGAAASRLRSAPRRGRLRPAAGRVRSCGGREPSACRRAAAASVRRWSAHERERGRGERAFVSAAVVTLSRGSTGTSMAPGSCLERTKTHEV